MLLESATRFLDLASTHHMIRIKETKIPGTPIAVTLFCSVMLLVLASGCNQRRYQPADWEAYSQTTLPDGAQRQEGMSLPLGTLPRSRGTLPARRGTLPSRMGTLPNRMFPSRRGSTLPGTTLPSRGFSRPFGGTLPESGSTLPSRSFFPGSLGRKTTLPE